jgi:spoIIIJ-associated protein
MSEYQEFTGKSVEEALKNAREALGVSDLREIDFEILTQGSRGVLGMGAEPARIVAARRSSLGAAPVRPSASAAAPPGDDRGSRVPARASRDEAPQHAPEAPAAPAAPPLPEVQGQPSAPARPPSGPDAERTRPAAPPRSGPEGSREPGGGRAGSPRRGRGGRADEAHVTSDSEAREVAVERARVDREEIQAADASPEALAAGKEILEQLVGLMGYQVRVDLTTEATPRITVYGADDDEREALGALIGRKGERLSALQHLVNLMLSRRMGEWTRVLVDVEDYRGRRERQLVEVARRAAERVLATGTMLQLEPMTALERRWVHIALRDVDGVATQSIGEEPQRRVVVLKT